MSDEKFVESRAQEYHALGKCTREVKAMIPDALGVALDNRVQLLGMTTSEYIRNLLTVNVFGAGVLEKVHADRMNAYAANAPESVIGLDLQR